jgi:hypothetical protein
MAVSQDATDDIALGVTDSASSYTIASLHLALDTHLRLRGQIKRGKEAQGYVGVRKSTKVSAFASAIALSSELIQMCFQDVKVVDVQTNEVWKQPHVMAAIIAGMRLGSEIGEPMTYKFINVLEVGHYVDASTGIEGGNFNPAVDFETAIEAGVTFTEPVNGGFRVVVDNTTYGKDNSFVWNRGSVIEAAFYTAKSVRQLVDVLFIGKKVAGDGENSMAASIKTAIRNLLRDLRSDDILSGSDDAPEGYVEETFVVSIVGNTAYVSVEIKPINGLDFVLIEFTLGQTTQTA